MGNSPQGGYSVTDYLNAILNYPALGTSYYNNMVNQLMSLGYVLGGWNYQVGEHHIYGSSRIGVHQTNTLLRSQFANGDIFITLEDVEYTALFRGKRHYELSNHLGNVQVVISDKRISVCEEYLAVERFEAEVLSAVDYYPFGMMIPDRQWYAGSDSSNYAYGFQGQEKDDEISGAGNSISFKYRFHDARLGRFLSLDPLSRKYPYNSPYSFSQNRVIDGVELEGLEVALLSHDINYTAGLAITLASGVAWDTKGNAAAFTSHGEGGSPAVGISYGTTYVFFPSMPDISFAEGPGYEVGFTFGAPVGMQGGIAIVKSGIYYGVAVFNGYGGGMSPYGLPVPYAQKTHTTFSDAGTSPQIYLRTLSDGYRALALENLSLNLQIEKHQIQGAAILNQIAQLENALDIQVTIDNHNQIASELHNKNVEFETIMNNIEDLKVRTRALDAALKGIIDETVKFQLNQQNESKANSETKKADED